MKIWQETTVLRS
jgi:hypothetical protein